MTKLCFGCRMEAEHKQYYIERFEKRFERRLKMITMRKGSLKVKIFKRKGLVYIKWYATKKDSRIVEYGAFLSPNRNNDWTSYEESGVWWSRNVLKVVVSTTFPTAEAAKCYIEKANP